MNNASNCFVSNQQSWASYFLSDTKASVYRKILCTSHWVQRQCCIVADQKIHVQHLFILSALPIYFHSHVRITELCRGYTKNVRNGVKKQVGNLGVGECMHMLRFSVFLDLYRVELSSLGKRGIRPSLKGCSDLRCVCACGVCIFESNLLKPADHSNQAGAQPVWKAPLIVVCLFPKCT